MKRRSFLKLFGVATGAGAVAKIGHVSAETPVPEPAAAPPITIGGDAGGGEPRFLRRPYDNGDVWGAHWPRLDERDVYDLKYPGELLHGAGVDQAIDFEPTDPMRSTWPKTEKPLQTTVGSVDFDSAPVGSLYFDTKPASIATFQHQETGRLVTFEDRSVVLEPGTYQRVELGLHMHPWRKVPMR